MKTLMKVSYFTTICLINPNSRIDISFWLYTRKYRNKTACLAICGTEIYQNIMLMKPQITIILLTLLLISVAAFSQSTAYNNEWINHNQNYFKIKVHENKLHRINYNALVASELPLHADGFQLYKNGQQVPIHVSTDGILGNNDYIEFYGQKNDGQLDQQLYENDAWMLHTYKSMFTDTASYYLTSNIAMLNLRYNHINNTLGGTLPPAETHFVHETNIVFDEYCSPGAPFKSGINFDAQDSNIDTLNYYFADYSENEGFISDLFYSSNGSQETFTYTIETPAIYTGADATTPSLESLVIGRSYNPTVPNNHHVSLTINNNEYFNEVFSNYDRILLNNSLNLTDLSSPTTELHYTAIGDLSNHDSQAVSYAKLSYPHGYDFENTASFVFSVGNNTDKYFEATNFNGGLSPILYDLTHNLRLMPQLASDGETYRFFLPQVPGSTATNRRLVLSSTTASGSITYINNENIHPINFTNFSNAANQGDYIIISHPRLRNNEGDPVQQYADYRADSLGGQHNVVLVDVEELYEQFAYGIPQHPISIRNFINYAVDNWELDPNYLLLIGKSVMGHRTYLDSLAYTECLVPTWGHKGSDNLLAVDSVGAYIPQLAVGRIPATNATEVHNYFKKIQHYEAAQKSCSYEDKAWMKKSVQIFEANFAESYDEMVVMNNDNEALFTEGAFGGTSSTYSGIFVTSIPQPEFKNEFDDGLGLVTYMGDAHNSIWHYNIDTVEVYNNKNRHPVFFVTGHFSANIHEPKEICISKAQQYTLADSIGAIAYIAPSDMYNQVQNNIDYNQHLYNLLVGNSYGLPLGSTLNEAIASYTDSLGNYNKMAAQHLTLVGDPALRFSVGENPDLTIPSSSLRTFDPETGEELLTSGGYPHIPNGIDSVEIHVEIANIGKYTAGDSLTVNIARKMLDDSLMVAVSQRIALPKFKQELVFLVANNVVLQGDNILGQTFVVQVDTDGEIVETCEDNNKFSQGLSVQPICSGNLDPLEISECLSNDTINFSSISINDTYTSNLPVAITNNQLILTDIPPNTYSLYHTYLDTLSDCIYQTHTTLELYPDPNIDLGTDMFVSPGEPLEIVPVVEQGIVAYEWSTGETIPSIMINEAGVYTVTVSNNNGCTNEASINVYPNELVWPGDANNSGIADMLDLIAIGLAYDATGPARPDQGTDWEGKACYDWETTYSDSVLYSKNHKHADCNGDGFVNSDDVAAIEANYFSGAERYGAPPEELAGYPLFWELTDTIITNAEYTFAIHLGNDSIIAEDVYGIAFRANFSVNTGDSIPINQPMISFQNSWLGDVNEDLITIDTSFNNNYQWDIALSRIDHTNRSNTGEICRMVCIMDVSSLNPEGKLASDYEISANLSFSNIHLTSASGARLPIEAEDGDFQITIHGTGIKDVFNQQTKNPDDLFTIAPNPANNKVYLQHQLLNGSNNNDTNSNFQITVYNLSGKKLVQQTYDKYQNNVPIDISQLTAGYYFVQLTDGQNNASQKLIVTN